MWFVPLIPQEFVHRHNCRWRPVLSMFGLLLIDSYKASPVKGMRFSHFADVQDFLGPGRRLQAAKDTKPPGALRLWRLRPCDRMPENLTHPQNGKLSAMKRLFDPFIVPVDPKDASVTFSAWAYAEQRCQVLGAKAPLVFPTEWQDVTAERVGTVVSVVRVRTPK
jgi:hypothetical protein